MLDQGIIWDYAKFIMDIEMIRMLKKVLGGIVIDDVNMALDVIKEIGAAGEYVSHAHTLKHFKELSSPKMFDRSMREAWEANGATSITERAYDEARAVLQKHKPLDVPAGAEKAMRDIVNEAEEYYGLAISDY